VLDLKTLNEEDLHFELNALLKHRRELMASVDQIDTEIIGLKEELRLRKEQRGKQ
jgi:hypothetical protein